MTKAQFQLQSQPRGKGKPKNNWIAKWKKSLRRTINDYESTDSLINIHSFIHYKLYHKLIRLTRKQKYTIFYAIF